MIKIGESYKFVSSSRYDGLFKFSGKKVTVLSENNDRDPETERLWNVVMEDGHKLIVFESEISGELEESGQYYNSEGKWIRDLCFSCEKRPKKYATGLCECCHQITVKADLGPEYKTDKKVFTCISEADGEFACILGVRSSLESAKKIPKKLGYEQIGHSNRHWQKGECKITILEDDLLD